MAKGSVIAERSTFVVQDGGALFSLGDRVYPVPSGHSIDVLGTAVPEAGGEGQPYISEKVARSLGAGVAPYLQYVPRFGESDPQRAARSRRPGLLRDAATAVMHLSRVDRRMPYVNGLPKGHLAEVAKSIATEPGWYFALRSSSRNHRLSSGVSASGVSAFALLRHLPEEGVDDPEAYVFDQFGVSERESLSSSRYPGRSAEIYAAAGAAMCAALSRAKDGKLVYLLGYSKDSRGSSFFDHIGFQPTPDSDAWRGKNGATLIGLTDEIRKNLISAFGFHGSNSNV